MINNQNRVTIISIYVHFSVFAQIIGIYYLFFFNEIVNQINLYIVTYIMSILFSGKTIFIQRGRFRFVYEYQSISSNEPS